MPHRPPRPELLVLGIALTLAVAGCSKDQPSASAPTTSSTSTSSPTASDVASTSPSGAGSSTPSSKPYPVSSLSPKAPKALAALPFTLAERSDKPTATLTVGSLTTGETGTRLTFWVNSTDKNLLGREGLGEGIPEEYPTLTDPATKTVYRVDTWTHDGYPAGCICSGGPNVTATAIQPQDASYPPLPASVKSVQLTLPGAKAPVTVEVTR